jgi:plasmid stabilization system protein ParE
MKIFLTKRAEKNYRAIKQYILEEWGEPVAKAFEQRPLIFLIC